MRGSLASRRMALANYLAHSLIFLGLFYGFGLALLGRVGATFCLGLSVVIFGAKVRFRGHRRAVRHPCRILQGDGHATQIPESVSHYRREGAKMLSSVTAFQSLAFSLIRAGVLGLPGTLLQKSSWASATMMPAGPRT